MTVKIIWIRRKMVKAIDVWFNLLPLEVRKTLFDEPEVKAAKDVEKLDRGQEMESILPDELVKTMDAAGVEMTLLVTMQQGCSFRMYPGKPNPRQVQTGPQHKLQRGSALHREVSEPLPRSLRRESLSYDGRRTRAGDGGQGTRIRGSSHSYGRLCSV